MGRRWKPPRKDCALRSATTVRGIAETDLPFLARRFLRRHGSWRQRKPTAIVQAIWYRCRFPANAGWTSTATAVDDLR